MSEKLSGLSQLLYTLSRLPGLGFLYDAAAKVDKVRDAKQNLDSAANIAKDLKGNEKK